MEIGIEIPLLREEVDRSFTNPDRPMVGGEDHVHPMAEPVAGLGQVARPPDIPTVTLEPGSSPADIEIDVSIPFTLGHRGHLSPVELDGSSWQPVGGTDAEGGNSAVDRATSGHASYGMQSVMLLRAQLTVGG